MTENQTLKIVKRLAAELGYEVKMARLADGRQGGSFRLDNGQGEAHSFAATNAGYALALRWLRKKA